MFQMIPEIPAASDIIDQLSHNGLREVCGYGHNASIESLRKVVRSALNSGNFPHLARDLANIWQEEHRR